MLDYSKPVHILRYGTNADQKHIENMNHPYDLLAINGNMLAHSKNSISTFILNSLIPKKKGFFIDPITYAFQLNLNMIKSESKKTNEFTIKRSIKSLIESYGEPIKTKVLDEDRLVLPQDFSSDEIIKSYCENVINFQKNTVRDSIIEKGYEEYIKSSDFSMDKLYPDFVVPPYFYLVPGTMDSWIKLNIKFINFSRDLFPDDYIFAQLTLSKETLLNTNCIEKIIESYSSLNINGILLWIDDFNAHEASDLYLKNFIYLVKSLYKPDRKLINLYGSFFSIILCGYKDILGFGLDGAGHGLEYGEYRAVAPVGGGIPTSKYYFYPLHLRLDYKTASQLLIALGFFKVSPKDGYLQYLKEICRCPICKTVLKDDITKFSIFENTLYYEVHINGVTQRRPYASAETKEVCLYHYLLNKNREFLSIQKQSFDTMLNELKTTYEKYSQLGKLSLEELSYLQIWYCLLSEYGNEIQTNE